MIVPSSLTPIRVVVAEHGIDRRGERLGALLVGLFVVTISQAAHSQRPDTVVWAGGGGPAQVVVDTSGRLYGASKVPRSIGTSLGVIDSATIAASAARVARCTIRARHSTTRAAP